MVEVNRSYDAFIWILYELYVFQGVLCVFAWL